MIEKFAESVYDEYRGDPMGLKSILKNALLSTALETISTGGKNVTGLLSALQPEEGPRSLNACDRLYLPQIRKDFPDFDPHLAKLQIEAHLISVNSHRKHFAVHQIAIARYLPTRLSKTIVYQAAVCCNEHGKKQEKRMDIFCTYSTDSTDGTIAANCPNCAGVLEYGQTQCPFCGSQVTAPMGERWKITKITET